MRSPQPGSWLSAPSYRRASCASRHISTSWIGKSAERETHDIAVRRDGLRTEQLQLFDTAESVAHEVEAAKVALDIARAHVIETSEALKVATATAQEARDTDALARTEALRTEEDHTALEGKLHALDALERERVGLAPAAARLLGERDRFGDGAILGPLSDFITTESVSAGLIERYLGANVHAVLVRDRAVAEAVRAWHATSNPGSLLLLPIDAIPSGEDTTSGDLAQLVQSASAAMGWVRALLGNVASVQDGSAFIDARGAVWLPAAIAGPGPLRRRAERNDVQTALISIAAAKERATVAAAQARDAMQLAVRAANEAGDQANVAGRDVRQSEDRLNEVLRRHQRATREVSEADAMITKLTEREQMLAERMRLVDEQLETTTQSAATQDSDILEVRHALSAAERAHDETREQRTEIQVHQAQAHARVQVVMDREHRLHEELTNAASRLDSLQAELSTLSDADAQLAGQLADWQLNLEAREAMLHDAESQFAAAEFGVNAADMSLQTAEHTLDSARRDASTAADQLHAAELRYSELSGRQSTIRERLETEWKKPLEELLATVVEVDADDQTLRAEATQLRDQLDALGPVNPLAIEEHDEEVKRLEFLQKQHGDLVEAKQSLQQAIKEIDATARELFLQTFTQVRENFRNIFMVLFGGGDCDLRLENPEFPLDGDIEIHAAPRGKKTQRIHLLSSGERALVALSLLFSIFLTKPSPFCLLDEVDAPLDDQNIGRFVRMLNQFKQNTQFIVITHNPRTTTEAADAVYGVTMQEPGVSSIVSVRLRGKAVEDIALEGKPAPEPATAGV